MTLALSSITSFGIVITADSRQTYRNVAGVARVGSDSGMKLFQLNKKVGVAISGRAFLPDEMGRQKNTGWYIEQFRRFKLDNNWGVKQIASELNDHLSKLFVKKEVENLKKRIQEEITKRGGKDIKFIKEEGNLVHYEYSDKEGQTVKDAGSFDTVNLIVAGIDADGIGRVYTVYVPRGIDNEKDTINCGAVWIGQTDVLQRVIKGYAPEIGGLKFFQETLSSKGKEEINSQLNTLEYIISWGTITIQDAVDFCILMTKTTESIQRFSDGTYFKPGSVPGVGGDIDVAIITPEKGFVWLQKKEIRTDEKSLNLESLADISPDKTDAGGSKNKQSNVRKNKKTKPKRRK